MARLWLTLLALLGAWWAVACPGPARAQMGPWNMHAQLRLHLQWQRHQQRLVQQQARSLRASSGPPRTANTIKQLARQQAAQEKRLVQLMKKQEQHRLTLLRRITVADFTAMRRIQKVASSVRPALPLARPRAPTALALNVTQPRRAGRSMPLAPRRDPAASLLDELAPLMFLHGREKPSSPSNFRLRASPTPAPMFVRVPIVPAEMPPRIIRKATGTTSSSARLAADPAPIIKGENAVMQLVERIIAGEWRTRKREPRGSCEILPQQVTQAPPRPVLAVAHPLPAPPSEQAFPSSTSSRPSLVEVVLQAPPLPSIP
jgi:hypothetical protein